MNWEATLATIIFMIIGYLIGSLSTAIIASNFLAHDDVRRHGSGNAGATNMSRTYGKAAGASVFLIDVTKPVLVVTIAYLTKTYADGDFFRGIVLPAVGFATLIGHVYPLFFKFKGGKGAASFVGLIVTTEWVLIFIGAVIFFLVLWRTQMVAVGSIVGSALLIPFQIGSAFINALHQPWIDPFSYNQTEWWIASIFLILAWLILFWRHRGNIKRIKAGNELRFSK